jgi:cold shock CspA family protein/predicted Ser/Thr protein kinase
LARGRVKWFNSEKGFGFLLPDDGSDDVFVHYPDIVGTGFRTLDEGELVEYEVGQGQQGPKALQVRRLGAATGGTAAAYGATGSGIGNSVGSNGQLTPGLAQGKVKWFNSEKGIGFLTPDDGSNDTFVHYSEIVGTGVRTLDEGDRVEYKVGQGQLGPQALAVRRLSASVKDTAAGESSWSPPGDDGQLQEPQVGEPGVPLAADDPRVIGPYTVHRRLGEGAMGTVYLARAGNDANVALKVIRAEFARDESFLKRFLREVANARRVQDFCTAAVLDAAVDNERPYLVTEFIDGPTLAEHVGSEGALPASKVHGLAVGMAAALVAIHHAGVVHRDLKPSNVMLSPFGPKVIDFGIARSLDSTTVVTQNIARLGTPAYMSPEQIETGDIGFASDVFSWAGTIIFAATGREPFGQGAPMAIMFRIMDRDPVIDAVPAHLQPVIRAAMNKNPGARPSAQKLLSLLTGSTG